MSAPRLTRRQFVRDSAAGAAALAASVALPNIVRVGNAEELDTASILSYNPDMEYRRCGRTGWMVSAVCLGGHWKRVNQMVPGLFEGESWLSAKLDNAGFPKEPLRRRHALHRAGHQLHRRLYRRRDPGVQQSARRPPRQDVLGLVVVRTRGPQSQPVQRRFDHERVRRFAARVQTGIRGLVSRRLRGRRAARQGWQVGFPAHRGRVGGHRGRPAAGEEVRQGRGPPGFRPTICRGSST